MSVYQQQSYFETKSSVSQPTFDNEKVKENLPVASRANNSIEASSLAVISCLLLNNAGVPSLS